MEILTAGSARVRAARQLAMPKHRRATGRFLAEGPQAVREALAEAAALELLVDEAWLARRAAELAVATSAGVPVHVVQADAFARLVSATTPQGVVAVCRWDPPSLADVVAGRAAPDGPSSHRDAVSGPIALAHEMADPGNAGALIRVADAAGAAAVALSAGSVDPTNSKCVRATAGSLFHLPVVSAGDTHDALGLLRAGGWRVLAADVGADSVDIFTAERAGLLHGRIAWVFGNEAHGLPERVLSAADHVVRIPILGRAESLNVATAAAVCLYASARTRAEQEVR